MIRLDFMILADAANVGEGKLHLLGAGITRVTPATLPSALNLAVAVRFQVDDVAELEQLDNRLEIVHPDGTVATTIQLGSGHAPPLDILEGEDIGAMMVLQFAGYPVTLQGPYTFRIRSADGATVAERRIVVDVRPQTG